MEHYSTSTTLLASLFRFIRHRLFSLFLFGCLLLIAVPPLPLMGQFKFREPPNRRDPQPLEEADEERIWQRFLFGRHLGAFTLEGTLAYRPARAASVRYSLRMTGRWLIDYQRTDIALVRPDGTRLHQQVLLDGSGAHIRQVSEAAAPGEMRPLDVTSSIDDGLPFTWADILMPYLDWPMDAYLGPDRYLGRPAHRFLLRNPDPVAAPSHVIVTLDEVYAALLKVDLYEPEDRLKQRIRVGGFRQFGQEWMFSELYWEDRVSRDSVRLDVAAYSLEPSSPGADAQAGD